LNPIEKAELRGMTKIMQVIESYATKKHRHKLQASQALMRLTASIIYRAAMQRIAAFIEKTEPKGS